MDDLEREFRGSSSVAEDLKGHHHSTSTWTKIDASDVTPQTPETPALNARPAVERTAFEGLAGSIV